MHSPREAYAILTKLFLPVWRFRRGYSVARRFVRVWMSASYPVLMDRVTPAMRWTAGDMVFYGLRLSKVATVPDRMVCRAMFDTIVYLSGETDGGLRRAWLMHGVTFPVACVGIPRCAHRFAVRLMQLCLAMTGLAKRRRGALQQRVHDLGVATVAFRVKYISMRQHLNTTLRWEWLELLERGQCGAMHDMGLGKACQTHHEEHARRVRMGYYEDAGLLEEASTVAINGGYTLGAVVSLLGCTFEMERGGVLQQYGARTMGVLQGCRHYLARDASIRAWRDAGLQGFAQPQLDEFTRVSVLEAVGDRREQYLSLSHRIRFFPSSTLVQAMGKDFTYGGLVQLLVQHLHYGLLLLPETMRVDERLVASMVGLLRAMLETNVAIRVVTDYAKRAVRSKHLRGVLQELYNTVCLPPMVPVLVSSRYGEDFVDRLAACMRPHLRGYQQMELRLSMMAACFGSTPSGLMVECIAGLEAYMTRCLGVYDFECIQPLQDELYQALPLIEVWLPNVSSAMHWVAFNYEVNRTRYEDAMVRYVGGERMYRVGLVV
jgi:hypothetical protein